jgi:hypothetical protein
VQVKIGDFQATSGDTEISFLAELGKKKSCEVTKLDLPTSCTTVPVTGLEHPARLFFLVR